MHGCAVHAMMLQSCSILGDPRTLAHHAPLSMGFSRQEYWSGLSYPFPGDLPDPGIEPMSLMSPASAGRFFTASIMWDSCVPGHILGIVGSLGS